MQQLTQHVRSLMKIMTDDAATLHRKFMPFASTTVAKKTRAILSNPQAISEALIDLNQKLEFNQTDLEQGLHDLVGEPLNLKEELSAREFLDGLDASRIILDEGVSPFHGKFGHAIQHYILQFHLGSKHVEDLFQLIRSGPIVSCEFTENRQLTLFDEFLDRMPPIEIPNSERISCREALTNALRTPVLLPSCLDARSPEWLTTAITLANNHSIDQVFDGVSNDLRLRGHNVHENMYITGFEDEAYLQIIS